jgi:hypothetical protein
MKLAPVIFRESRTAGRPSSRKKREAAMAVPQGSAEQTWVAEPQSQTKACFSIVDAPRRLRIAGRAREFRRQFWKKQARECIHDCSFAPGGLPLSVSVPTACAVAAFFRRFAADVDPSFALSSKFLLPELSIVADEFVRQPFIIFDSARAVILTVRTHFCSIS